MKLIITAAITAALAGAIGFIAGRAHQAEIDAKQAILLDSLALSALKSGETHHASYYLDGSLRGNLDLLDRVRRNALVPSHPSRQWKEEGDRWQKQLEWTRERIAQPSPGAYPRKAADGLPVKAQE